MAGDYAADSAALDPSDARRRDRTARARRPRLRSARSRPASAMRSAARRAISTSAGRSAWSTSPAAARRGSTSADVIGPGGARARVFGGSGVTYYWPAGGLRIDGNIEMARRRPADGRVSLRQPRAGAPMSGVADLAPYTAGGQRLALAPIRFGPGPGGSTALSTVAQLDGAFPERPRAGAAPADPGPDRPRRQLRLRHRLRGRQLQLSADERRSSSARRGCRSARSARRSSRSSRAAPVLTSARISSPVLNGRLGSSPLHLAAASGRHRRAASPSTPRRCGSARPSSPIVFDAARLNGSFAGAGDLRGNFTGAKATIGNVPLLLSDGVGQVARPQQRSQRRQRADGFRPRPTIRASIR